MHMYIYMYVHVSRHVTCRRCCSALVELRQHETREKCLKQWQVPDEIRTAPDRSEKPRDRLQKLLGVSEGAEELDVLRISAVLPKLSADGLTYIRFVVVCSGRRRGVFV